MSKKTKILVVDDNETVRASMQRSLQSEGRVVEFAAEGSAALRAMEEQSFDVVLLDLRMPGMDGMTVLKTIKQRWPQSEVVIITGYPTIETAVEAVRLGAFDYLAKPVGPDEIVTAADGASVRKKWTLRDQAVSRTGQPPDSAQQPAS